MRKFSVLDPCCREVSWLSAASLAEASACIAPEWGMQVVPESWGALVLHPDGSTFCRIVELP